MACGYGIPYDKLDEVYDAIQNKFANQKLLIFEKMPDGFHRDKGEISLADIYVNLFRDRIESERGTIDGAQLALDMMSNFLQNGSWHFGLKTIDGQILEDIGEWPDYPLNKEGAIHWIKDDHELVPIIWFGMKGQAPIDCWTLCDSPQIKNCKSYLGAEDTIIHQENWKHFWFCEFWTMDWNVLWDNDEAAIIWAFSECGMDEPTEDFYKVRKDCPIELLQEDSTEVMLNKISAFCYFMQKKYVLEKAIIKAGYNVGKNFVALNQNGEKLEDGRPNPAWLDIEFADQLSEALYGDSQVDDVEIDNRYFEDKEFEGCYSYGNHWNVLERYVDNVEDLFCEGWHRFLKEQYGDDRDKYEYR